MSALLQSHIPQQRHAMLQMAAGLFDSQTPSSQHAPLNTTSASALQCPSSEACTKCAHRAFVGDFQREAQLRLLRALVAALQIIFHIRQVDTP